MSDLQNKEAETKRFHETVSKNALSVWGVHDVAYVKEAVVNEDLVWVIYAAEGTKLAIAPNRATAMAMIKQSELEPMSAH